MKNRVKQLLMCVLFSLCIMPIYSMNEDTRIKNRKNRFITAVGALSFSWGALGASGFVAHSKLKSCALKQTENPQYAQKLLKYARVSRVGGYLSITPLVSLMVGYPIFRIGYISFNNTMENVGTLALIPAIPTVIVPANVYVDRQEKEDLKKFKE